MESEGSIVHVVPTLAVDLKLSVECPAETESQGSAGKSKSKGKGVESAREDSVVCSKVGANKERGKQMTKAQYKAQVMLEKSLREEKRRSAFKPPYRIDRHAKASHTAERPRISTVNLTPLWALGEYISDTAVPFPQSAEKKAQPRASTPQAAARPRSAFGYRKLQNSTARPKTAERSKKTRKQRGKRRRKAQKRPYSSHQRRHHNDSNDVADIRGLLPSDEQQSVELLPLQGQDLYLGISDSFSKKTAGAATQVEADDELDLPCGEFEKAISPISAENDLSTFTHNAQQYIYDAELRKAIRQSRESSLKTLLKDHTYKALPGGKKLGRPQSAFAKRPATAGSLGRRAEKSKEPSALKDDLKCQGCKSQQAQTNLVDKSKKSNVKKSTSAATLELDMSGFIPKTSGNRRERVVRQKQLLHCGFTKSKQRVAKDMGDTLIPGATGLKGLLTMRQLAERGKKEVNIG